MNVFKYVPSGEHPLTMEQLLPTGGVSRHVVNVVLVQPVGAQGSAACGHYQAVLLLDDVKARLFAETSDGTADHYVVKPFIGSVRVGACGSQPSTTGMYWCVRMSMCRAKNRGVCMCSRCTASTENLSVVNQWRSGSCIQDFHQVCVEMYMCLTVCGGVLIAGQFVWD